MTGPVTPAPLRDLLASLAPGPRAAFLASLTPEEAEGLAYDWPTWARPEQVPPDGDPSWTVFLALGGRGSGKSRSGAEWIRKMAREYSGCRIALVGRTSADVRDTMVEGEAGLLAIHPPSERPLYEPSKRRLTWRNGSQATAFSADGSEGDQLRGPSHAFAWADEWCAWADLEAVHANLMLGLRLGERPRLFISTTPRPSKLLRSLMAAPTTLVRRASTYANAAYLAPSALAEFRSTYENTRLGRQELHAEVLEDVDGALWNRAMLDDNRAKEAPELVRVVVAVDPAVTSGEDSDETGVVVAGKDRRSPAHFYVLADLSCRLPPSAWARRVVGAHREWKADRVIAETNNGGDLVEATLRTVDASVPFRKVTATRGKRVRAEPISALYEQGRVHHVGAHAALEDQMCSFAPDVVSGSPDRLDALVWALTELSGAAPGAGLMEWYRSEAEKRKGARP